MNLGLIAAPESFNELVLGKLTQPPLCLRI